MQPNTSFRLRMCISPLMVRLNIIPFSPCPSPLQTHHITKSTLHQPIITSPSTISVHHPQTSPITSAYKLRPYVATMFENIQRMGDVLNVTNVKMLPISILNNQFIALHYLSSAQSSTPTPNSALPNPSS